MAFSFRRFVNDKSSLKNIVHSSGFIGAILNRQSKDLACGKFFRKLSGMKAKQSLAFFLSLSIIAIFTYGCCTNEKRIKHSPPQMTKLPPPLPAPASQEEKMAWFKEAKYGMFIHWGLYSIPAG